MSLDISPVHQRMAILWLKVKQKTATREEIQEFELCLEWNLQECQKQSVLFNLSLLATQTNDVDWQHQICARIDKLRK